MTNLLNKQLENLDYDYQHPAYYLEKMLLRHIGTGDLSEALRILDEINLVERSTLSENPIRSLKNSLIASCTLFARAAIEANVHPEEAFSQSDVCILALDKMTSVDQLTDYEKEMVRLFVHLVNQNRVRLYSKHVSMMMKYIQKNITSKITLHDFEVITGKSKEYLSGLFKKEVGQTITEYTQSMKIDVSKQFLEITDMPIHEIALMFNFSNASHYTRVFKKYTGMTPISYRLSINF